MLIGTLVLFMNSVERNNVPISGTRVVYLQRSRSFGTVWHGSRIYVLSIYM